MVPSAYRGDLALLRVADLPQEGLILEPFIGPPGDGPFHAVGADIQRERIWVYPQGRRLFGPGAPTGRLHTTAPMQPGMSGGALVDGAGRPIGIATGGGEGSYQAVPAHTLQDLLDGRDDPTAAGVTATLGAALRECAEALDSPRLDPDRVRALADRCLTSDNPGLLLKAGIRLGQSGHPAEAAKLHQRAVELAPNSLNMRTALLVSLQIAGWIDEMAPHARWLFAQRPDDPVAQRVAIQASSWTGNRDLAEAAFAHLEQSSPAQANAARRFLENSPPRPPQR